MKYYVTIFDDLITVVDENNSQLNEASSYYQGKEKLTELINKVKNYLTVEEWASITIEFK